MAENPPSFIDIDGNPRPANLTGGWLTLRDGKRLRYALVHPQRPTRGTVLLLQGRNETIEKYFETIGDLTARGFSVAIFDWRGQGGSDRMLRSRSRGHIDRIDTYVRDLGEFIDAVLLRDCRPPYVGLAHSLGGLVALAAVPQLVNRIERLVLSAPLVGLAKTSPGASLLPVLARAFRWLGLGRVPLRRIERSGARVSLARNPLTSDPVRFRRNARLVEAAPQLFVRSLTAAWLDASIRQMRRLDDSDVIARMHLPTLFVTAGADRVVDMAAAERLAWRMRSGHHLSIPGARHELLQEADEFRELFLAAFDGFVGSVTPLTPVASDPPVPTAVERELASMEAAIAEEIVVSG